MNEVLLAAERIKKDDYGRNNRLWQADLLKLAAAYLELRGKLEKLVAESQSNFEREAAEFDVEMQSVPWVEEIRRILYGDQG